MFTFKNLTPHSLRIRREDGSYMILPPEPQPARCSVERQLLDPLAGCQLVRPKIGEVTGLPHHSPGVFLIVSALVAEHPDCRDRGDLVYPGEAIRDADGRVIGAIGLCAGPGWAFNLAMLELARAAQIWDDDEE